MLKMPSLHKALGLYTKEERKENKLREAERQAEREVSPAQIIRTTWRFKETDTRVVSAVSECEGSRTRREGDERADGS